MMAATKLLLAILLATAAAGASSIPAVGDNNNATTTSAAPTSAAGNLIPIVLQHVRRGTPGAFFVMLLDAKSKHRLIMKSSVSSYIQFSAINLLFYSK